MNFVLEPENVKTPIPVPLHLRKAADAELRRAIKGGWLKPVHHATTWCATGMFVPPPLPKVGSHLSIPLEE